MSDSENGQQPAPPLPQVQSQTTPDEATAHEEAMAASADSERIKAFMDEERAKREQAEQVELRVNPDPNLDESAASQVGAIPPPPPDNMPEITDEMKEAYLTALLNDTRFSWDILSANGKFKVRCQVRSMKEQEFIMEAMAIREKEMRENPDASELAAQALHRFQMYSVLCMVTHVQGQPWDFHKELAEALDADDRCKADEVMEAGIKMQIQKMNQAVWNLVFSSVSRFEAICAELHTQAANESFSEPLGSD